MKNAFVEKYIQDNGLTVIHCDEQRPWGAYYVFEETSRIWQKILWLKPHALLSLQYHGTASHPGHAEEGEWLTEMALVLWKEDMAHLALDEISTKNIPTDVEVIKPAGKWEKFSDSCWRTPCLYQSFWSWCVPDLKLVFLKYQNKPVIVKKISLVFMTQQCEREHQIGHSGSEIK
jgi:hypothetical protein